jgi:hypothetical protein
MDHEKNRIVLNHCGIELCRRIEHDVRGEPVYFHAVVHEWQFIVIDDGLAKNLPLDEIARMAGVGQRTVLRRKKYLLGGPWKELPYNTL